VAAQKNQNAERNVDSKDCVLNVSNQNEDCIGNWSRDHSCYIEAKNSSTFFPCPKTLWETEFFSDSLVNLVEEISR
jgi:hypothetical protein